MIAGILRDCLSIFQFPYFWKVVIRKTRKKIASYEQNESKLSSRKCQEQEEYEWESGKRIKVNNTTVKEQHKTKQVGKMTRSHVGDLENKRYYVY